MNIPLECSGGTAVCALQVCMYVASVHQPSELSCIALLHLLLCPAIKASRLSKNWRSTFGKLREVLRIGVENRCWECFGIYFESWPVMELIHVTVIHVISRKQPSTWPCLGAQLLWGHRDPALRGQAMWDLYTIVHCTSLYTVQIRTAKCSQLNCENFQYSHLVSFSSVLPTFESATSHDIINIHKWHTVNVIKL